MSRTFRRMNKNECWFKKIYIEDIGLKKGVNRYHSDAGVGKNFCIEPELKKHQSHITREDIKVKLNKEDYDNLTLTDSEYKKAANVNYQYS